MFRASRLSVVIICLGLLFVEFSEAKCSLYLPFDDGATDASGNSNNGFGGEIISPAFISPHERFAGSRDGGVGGGSLAITETPGRVEIKTFPDEKLALSDTRYSLCVAFRCLEPPCSYSSGTLLSNRELLAVPESGFAISFQPTDILRIEYFCNISKIGILSYDIPLLFNDDNGERLNFHQLCFVFDGFNLQIYFDNKSYVNWSFFALQKLFPFPLAIGHDPNYGSFQGFIDELLYCPFDFGSRGVNAHWLGRQALVKAGLIAS